MGELKNTWEIAQERAARLGKLTAEEEEQQTKERYRQIGQVAVQKWLDGTSEQDLVEELNKFKEDERSTIREVVIEHLRKAIDFSNAQGMDRVKKAIQGISSLEIESQQDIAEIRNLVQEYEAAQKKIRLDLESNCKEQLHQMRISGTAVGDVNIEIMPQWQIAQQELLEAFTPRINSWRQGAN